MRKRSIIAGFLAILGFAGLAPAREAQVPQITSWSNTKTSDQKTAFHVEPGEKITFSLKAEDAENYIWEVDNAAQKGDCDPSFKWTAPNKKGLWKIQVKVINKSLDQYVAGLVADFKKFHKKDVPATIKDGYYPPQCRKEWIVSTFVKNVKPGESIAKAIDAVPPEGGIVELLAGVHKVKDTIHIRKSNVVVQGTVKSEIRSLDPTKIIFVVNENWKDSPALENITFRGFKITATYSGKNTAILLCKVNDSTVEGISASSVRMFSNTGGDGKNANNRMTIRNNTLDHGRIRAFYAKCIVVAYNTIISPGSEYGLHFEPKRAVGYECVSVHNNHLERKGHSGAHIQTEAPRCHFFNNTLVGGAMGITIRYYPDHTRVENNVITGATYAGIQVFRQTTMENNWITNNLIFNCPGHGVAIGDIPFRNSRVGLNCPYEITLANNVIYNCGGDGICRGARKSDDPWTINITNNIIANNGGYGINLVDEFIKGTRSYNNIWNNKKGLYNQAKPGAGDISVAPLFADPSKGDFHLKSKVGRWDAKAKKWVKDKAQSPCIDAGDPKSDFSREPGPNGERLNIGAYGNTKEASKSAGK